MSNELYYSRREDLGSVSIANRHWDLFAAALAIAASTLTTSDRQALWASWLADREQVYPGGGGFDVCQMPWSQECFESDLAFLLRTIELAKTSKMLTRLPARDSVDLIPILSRFADLVQATRPIDLDLTNEEKWSHRGRPTRWQRCLEHGIYEHAEGCLLCHLKPDPREITPELEDTIVRLTSCPVREFGNDFPPSNPE